MAEIVNLRLARKRKSRAEAEKQAEANRIQHGRTKSEKAITRAENNRREGHLDAHKKGD